MSFRLKTMLLVLGASTIPFVLISFVFIYQLTSDSKTFVEMELKKKTEHTVNMIEHEVRLIQNDLSATADMDVMSDILTLDLDMRIHDVISRKKEAFSIVGDYYVCDVNNSVIASTNADIKRGDRLNPSGMFARPIISAFGDKGAGFIYLDYKIKNLDKFLYSNALQKISIVSADKNITKDSGTLLTMAKISSMPGYAVMGELGDDLSLQKAKETLFLYFLGGFLLVGALVYVFASKIAKPILTLSEKVGEIADSKEYSKRLSADGNDEISKVSEAFNNLLSGIEEALENRLKLAEEQSKTKTLQDMANKLSRYISPQLVESIFSGEQNARLESKRKKLTIFFSDIVDFTATTDTMEAEDLSNLLNHYLNEMSQIALKHGATIDKFIGDAVMVFFGDPKSNGDKEDALSCVLMALEMRERLEELRVYWLGKGIAKPFRVRFGMHTGYCTVGNFGNEERMEYTIIGGSVNLASRIEDRASANQILLSEETYLLVRDKIECRYVDTIAVKGIAADVKVYEALGKIGSRKDIIEIKEEALELKINFDKVENMESIKRSLEAIIQEVDSRGAKNA